MTPSDTPGIGAPGGSNNSDRDSDLSLSMFTDLARPLGPLEAVERLRILETLSYGVLYEGRMFQASHGEPISLLELDPAFEREPQILARVLTDLLRASKLRDASILAPRGVFRHRESLYVLFDASTGISLATAFEFLGRSGLRLSSEAVLRIGSAALAALDCVSGSTSGTTEGYHGLFTPENVFLAEGQVVRVRGFGLWAEGGIMRTGLLGPGDLRYLAPSQRRTGLASARTDMLSLGVMLFEAVVGFPAFDAPPEEEDLSELRTSVEELQRKADTSMQDLYQIILSCLTPPGLITMPYRARLRKAVDTFFVREAARDRPFGALTLEDLVGRVKQRRPAIVKAIPMSLLPAESPGDPPGLEPQRDLTSEAPAEELSPEPEAAPSPEPEDLPPRPSSPTIPARPARGPRIPLTLWMFAGAAVAMVALALIFWNSWPRSAQPAPSDRPTAPAAEVSPLSVAATLPAVTAAVETPLSAISTPEPTLAPTEPPSRPTPAPPRIASARRAEAPTSGTRARRLAASKLRSERPATAPPSEAPAPPARAAAGEAPSAPSAVSAGALLPLGTPGLSRPVLLQKPENPRFGASDSRPAVERSVQLEILVNDLGRVRGNRIVRADSLPPGFFGMLERHLSGLRFRPAELGGVPVRVWMPYELRYWAP